MDDINALDILNQLDDNLILIGSNFAIEFANSTTEELVNIPATELQGKKCHSYFYNSSNPCKRCPLADLKKSGQNIIHDEYECMGSRYRIKARLIGIKNKKSTLLNIESGLDISPANKEQDTIEHAAQIGKTIITIQQGVAGVLGEKFFPAMVENLAITLEADYAFVGLLSGSKKQRVQTISFYNEGKIDADFSYNLKDSPCNDVFNSHMNSICEKVAELYPKDKLLVDMGIEGYIGIALKSSRGIPIGILVTLFKSPIQDIDLANAALEVFSARTEAEIERMQTEIELANANEKFRSIAENMPDVIFRVDTKLKGIYANSKVEDYAGITPEYFVGRGLNDLGLNEQFTKNRTDDLKKVLEKKESIRTIVSVNAFKGLRVLEWSMIPEFNEKGQVESVLNLVRDLTEARRTEMELNYLFNLSADLICLADLNGQFLKINPSWELLLGYAENEILSQSFYNLVHPDDVEKTREQFMEMLKANKTVYSFENRYKCRNGSYKWLSWVAQSYGDSDKIFCIARDVTDRKQSMKELIIAKEKAEEGDRLKTAFLANMSHEIRTPMNAIVGFSTLLKREGLTNEKRIYYSNIIEARSKDLLSIIHDILDISKIESEDIQIEQEEFSINEFLDELFQDFSQKIEGISGNQLELKIRKPKFKRSDRIKSDRVRIKQVMSNLIDNAIKFTKDGQVVFGAIPQSNKLLFFVSDTGIGIPKSKQKSIFERFRQVENSLTRQYGGNGLGLSISQALAQLMGGSIWVDSEEGTGSTFYFTIPNETAVAEKITVKQPIKIGKGIDLSKKHILIADDDKISCEFLRLVLKQVGANPVFVKTGEKTIELLKRKGKFDLFIFDINLKDIKGFELMQKVRQIDREVPAISLSSLYSPDAMARCKEVGCSEHLSKPILIDDLLAAIKRLTLNANA